LIAPPAPNTRCQGKPKPRRKTRATIRAAPGYPAILATPPYVETFPRGIARIACSIRSRIFPVCSVFFLTLFIPAHSRPARTRASPQRLIRDSSAFSTALATQAIPRMKITANQAAVRNASNASYSESCTSNTVRSLVTCSKSPTLRVRFASLIVPPALCAVVCSATSVPNPPESM